MLTAATAGAQAHAAPADIDCRLALASAPAAVPLRLRLTLTNRSRQPLDVLTWGTPFEGWLQPFLRVTRDGMDLPYQGPTVKRGDPGADEYLRLAPGRARSKTFGLEPVFDVAPPGRYRIESRLVLHDALRVADKQHPPRPRDRHEALALDCPALEFVRR